MFTPRLTKGFLIALRLHAWPQYRIAIEAGLVPSLLSKLLHGAEDIKPHDPRIARIGKILGLKPHECFNDSEFEDRGSDGHESLESSETHS
jgi:hypothetical protein